ncbi:hypothetical protein BZG75_14905 [Salinivibrio sp. AR640]|nr:hypothetical protein BZG75_14905 [Salinivibrio sp. AR640]
MYKNKRVWALIYITASGAKVGISITKLTGTEVANLNSRRDTRSEKRQHDVSLVPRYNWRASDIDD